MNRAFAIFILFFNLGSGLCLAQSPSPSDPQALALVAKSVAALSGGVPVSGVTLSANAISIAGLDYFTGTATLQAKGTTDSRVDLNVNGSTRTEIRTMSGGVPSGTWTRASAKSHPLAQHNCWTDAVWFFPALSSLSQSGTPGFLFSYVGPEQHNASAVEHIRVLRHLPSSATEASPVDTLSAMDIYLDAVSTLPLAIAFNIHSDNDININIPVEIRFADYQAVNGVQVPFHIQRLLNGGLVLDLKVTNAVMNSTLSASSSQVQQ
jgi:hypothetical protein